MATSQNFAVSGAPVRLLPPCVVPELRKGRKPPALAAPSRWITSWRLYRSAIRLQLPKTIGSLSNFATRESLSPIKPVSVVGRLNGSASAQDLTTDEKGRVSDHGRRGGLLSREDSSSTNASERKEGQYDLSSYEATYVFQVFNRP